MSFHRWHRRGLASTVAILVGGVLFPLTAAHMGKDVSRKWTLARYTKDLRPGLSRGAVEEYLQARGSKFERNTLTKNTVLKFDGIHLPSSPSDPPLFIDTAPPADIIKIGEDWGGIVCVNSNVVIVIEFTAPPGETSSRWRDRPSDKLTRISLSQQPGACM